MIVLEEPKEEAVVQPRVVRLPRVPTQKEIDAHSTTHLPHEPWCEVCMMGRGRNTPHRRRPSRRGSASSEAGPADVGTEPPSTPTGEGGEGLAEADSEEHDIFGGDSEDESSPTADASEEKLHKGPVPRVSMDYFYVSDPRSSKGAGAKRHVDQRAAEAAARDGKVGARKPTSARQTI